MAEGRRSVIKLRRSVKYRVNLFIDEKIRARKKVDLDGLINKMLNEFYTQLSLLNFYV